MTDPKTLTDEREAFEKWALGRFAGLGLRSSVRPAAWAAWRERATREQTASTGGQRLIGYVHPDFLRRWLSGEEEHLNVVHVEDGQAESDRWFDADVPLYAAPVEQAGSPPLVNPAQSAGKEKT